MRTIISAAEETANALRREAEQEAAARRRVGEEEARRVIEDAKADADAYLAERQRLIAELSDTVVERAETIVSRLDRAEEVRRQLQGLADALGESAERLASEVRVGTPPPTVRSPSGEVAPPPPATEDLVVPDTTAGEAPAQPAAEQFPPAVEEQPPPFAVEPEAELAPEAAAPEPEAPPLPAEEPVVQLDGRDTPAAETAEGARRDADQQLGARLVALQMAVAGGNRGEVEIHLRRTFDLEDPSSILDDVFGQGTDSEKRVAWPQSGEGAA